MLHPQCPKHERDLSGKPSFKIWISSSFLPYKKAILKIRDGFSIIAYNVTVAVSAVILPTDFGPQISLK